MLEQILLHLEKIPATFWGVVIGSLFTIVAVHLTNRANDRRLERQLTHDRDLKNRDRDLNLRKDVYLAASEAIAAGIAAIGRFADLNIPHEKLSEVYAEKAPAIAKVHVIASEPTARALSELQTELTGAITRLLARRIPIAVERERVRSLKDEQERFSRERDEMLQLLKQHNLEGSENQQRLATIQRFYEFADSQTLQLADETAKAHQSFAHMQYELAAECGAEALRIGKLIVPLLVAVRKELDMPIDPAIYGAILQEAQDKQQSTLAHFLNELHGKRDIYIES